jgi:hypothetical protein
MSETVPTLSLRLSPDLFYDSQTRRVVDSLEVLAVAGISGCLLSVTGGSSET